MAKLDLSKNITDTNKIKALLSSSDPRMISALIEGGKLNEESLKVLNDLTKERIKAAKESQQVNATAVNHVSTQNNHTSTGITVQKEVANKVLATSEVH